jgi:hypothetical protein
MACYPEFLKKFAHWCLWGQKWVHEGATHPVEERYSPITRWLISEPPRRDEFSSYERMVRCSSYELLYLDGAGIWVEDTLLVLRLRNCLDEDLNPLPWVEPIIDHFRTYWEYDGRHSVQCFFLADRKPPVTTLVSGGQVIEILFDGCFCRVSGDPLPESAEDVEPCQSALDWLLTQPPEAPAAGPSPTADRVNKEVRHGR